MKPVNFYSIASQSNHMNENFICQNMDFVLSRCFSAVSIFFLRQKNVALFITSKINDFMFVMKKKINKKNQMERAIKKRTASSSSPLQIKSSKNVSGPQENLGGERAKQLTLL